MRHARLTLGLCLGCLPMLGGCLFMHHSTTVVRENEQRRQVQYQNELAQQVFEARALNDTEREQESHSNSIAIPFLLWWSNTRTKSSGAYYNDAVAKCDKNHDQVITESEALAYNPKFAIDTASTAAVEVEPERPVQQASGTKKKPSTPSSVRVE